MGHLFSFCCRQSSVALHICKNGIGRFLGARNSKVEHLRFTRFGVGSGKAHVENLAYQLHAADYFKTT
jgi:hypothetical protein